MAPFGLALFGAVLTLALVWTQRRFLGFRAQSPKDYAGALPALDLRKHLNGPLICEGVIYGPTGRVSSRFVADIDAHWNGNVGKLSEKFRYSGGKERDRDWTFTVGNDGSIRAEAPDIVGIGTGQQEGPAVRLKYRIRLPEDSGGHVLDAIDWMYVVENGTIVNRSQFRKFGITVAELVATMRRKEAA